MSVGAGPAPLGTTTLGLITFGWCLAPSLLAPLAVAPVAPVAAVRSAACGLAGGAPGCGARARSRRRPGAPAAGVVGAGWPGWPVRGSRRRAPFPVLPGFAPGPSFSELPGFAGVFSALSLVVVLVAGPVGFLSWVGVISLKSSALSGCGFGTG